jgi:hypothetical protein
VEGFIPGQGPLFGVDVCRGDDCLETTISNIESIIQVNLLESLDLRECVNLRAVMLN